jgi:hypothetical protein
MVFAAMVQPILTYSVRAIGGSAATQTAPDDIARHVVENLAAKIPVVKILMAKW